MMIVGVSRLLGASAVATALVLSACAKDDPGKKADVPIADQPVTEPPGPATPPDPAANDTAAKPTPADEPRPQPADASLAAGTPSADAPAGAPGSGAGGEDKATDEDKPAADEPPRNLKVLPRTWTRKQVTTFMKKEVNRGLGVKCDFCHVKNDFASDENEHKVAARKMMKMTNAMNKEFFKGEDELKCFTCHKGKEEPGK
jgi:hypothetical protein